ncbi:HAD family hydrolase [Roseivirga spongicola]|uniref:HAD family hydrolase n=1 Tax=Roseivirga spongicola TaxID=333140 RepID=UPI002AC9ED35|nr:HAD family hydrolase [Roseivirga spongicola]WPZ09606.1 HAD hydrolase-like protein [Roseivirga spongicola]
MDKIKTIAFDADDTLWVNEPIFTDTRLKFEEILGKYISINENLEMELYSVESRNLKLFGYGIKGFTLSMVESALELTNYAIKGKDIERIIFLGKEMLEHPVQVLPDIEEVLDILENHYHLMIITKGDLWDQENKIARSGLMRYFDTVEIVSEKNVATYREVLKRNSINATEFLMIGNSLKSDVLPVIEMGAQAIHIPFHDTWTHEMVDKSEVNELTYIEMSSVSKLPEYLGV